MTPPKSVTKTVHRARAWLPPVLLAAACITLPSVARGDGGTLRTTTQVGGVEISIYTDSSTVRTGTVDISILVQPVPRGVRRPLPALQVCAYPKDSPRQRHCEPASTARAMNKLFQAAQLEMPTPGTWRVEVQIDTGQTQAIPSFDLEVVDGYPVSAGYGAWIGLPAVVVFLFILHRRLATSRRRRAAKQQSSSAPLTA